MKEKAMVVYMEKRLGRRPLEGLSSTLENTLKVIGEFVATHEMVPTVSEVAEILGIKVPSARAQILRLEEKGYIRRTRGKVRTMEILKGPVRVPSQVRLPVIGKVAAGLPIFAEENIIGEIAVSSANVRGRCFALEVVGDSMIDAGINEGDFLIVRHQPVAENGEIVVALLDDEATVKRLSIVDERIELRPANPNYKPIPIGYETSLHIVGKVVAVSAKDSTIKY